jgi:hypothetical protein
VRRLLLVAALLGVVRWVALELASLVGRRFLPPSPPSRGSPRQPGRIPGPFDHA